MGEVAKFVVSIDVKLFWGLHHRADLDDWRPRLLEARRALPQVLALFEAYQVRATWAVLGFLFYRHRDELLAQLPCRLPAYQIPGLSPYAHLARIGDRESEDPFHFGASLVEQIGATVGQEVACGTLANFRCLEKGQGAAEFEADLRAALGIARRWGLLLRSLVFPADQVCQSYLPICHRLGIAAYRGHPPVWPYGPRLAQERQTLRRWAAGADAYLPLTGTRCVRQEQAHRQTPVNVPATRRLRPMGALAGVAGPAQRRRIVAEMDCAARRGRLFHLRWVARDFGGNREPMLELLAAILERFDGWRRLGRMESCTMHDVVLGDSGTDHPPVQEVVES